MYLLVYFCVLLLKNRDVLPFYICVYEITPPPHI